MSRIGSLIQRSDQLLNKRNDLLSLWQDIADNFYPERADFTLTRNLGKEFASDLMSSYPLIVRRELGNAFSAMLRPRDRAWFSITTNREEGLDRSGREWLERATDIQRRAMYDRHTQFVRATKEGDNDFATFGQCVISQNVDWRRQVLLYQCWHLRDVAWCEDYSGMVSEVHRRWKPEVLQLQALFPKKLHAKVVERVAKEPYAKIECRHIVMPVDQYNGETKFRTPYVSIYLDVENQHIIEETGAFDLGYTIPRWQTVSGSQYAYSPATVVGLPDARLIQAMTLTLLEAGETAVRPPMVATKDAIRSDVALYAGGITWVDADYDERLGEVLRPLTQDKRSLPFGMEFNDSVRSMLAQAFFLNKLELPPADGKMMTAFETAQRVQEYIRNALPLFEPMEIEYNGALCEQTFNSLMRVGAFGPVDEIPESIRGADVEFKFESPLHRALDREKSARFQEGRQLLLEAAEIDPKSIAVMDVRKALRDALEGVGVPAKWTRDEEVVDAMVAQQEQTDRIAQAAALAEQGGKGAKEVAQADMAMRQSAAMQ